MELCEFACFIPPLLGQAREESNLCRIYAGSCCSKQSEKDSLIRIIWTTFCAPQAHRGEIRILGGVGESRVERRRVWPNISRSTALNPPRCSLKKTTHDNHGGQQRRSSALPFHRTNPFTIWEHSISSEIRQKVHRALLHPTCRRITRNTIAGRVIIIKGIVIRSWIQYSCEGIGRRGTSLSLWNYQATSNLSR